MRPRTLLLLGAAAALACRSQPASLRFPGAPVVLVSIDTLRSDHLPAYGYREVETPYLDRFRADAILFRHAYSPCPMTLPAHVTMLTGEQPFAHGVRSNVGFTFRADAHPSLPVLLKGRGYATGAAVSSYVLRPETGLRAAFDDYEASLDPRPGAAFAEYQRPGGTTAGFARQWVGEHKAQPFFFFLHLYEPHVPYDPPQPFATRFRLPYDGEIATADAILGGFLDELRRLRLYDKAIVIVTSDHGEGLGDHGEDQHSILLYREALQVPLLVKLPGSARAGETVDAPAELADLVPTLADLLGFEKPAAASGASLLRLGAQRTLYAETLYPRLQLGWSDLRSLVGERYHYIDGPRPELYDLVEDPRETRDLVATQGKVAAQMRSELLRYPAGPVRPGPVDPQAAERLAALGYVGTPRDPAAGPLPNPRDNLPALAAMREAARLAGDGRQREAARVLRGLVDKNPAMVDVWTKLGDLQLSIGSPEEAAAAYGEALRRGPLATADMVLALGQAELLRGRLAEAEAAARRALPALPGRAHVLLARVALGRGRLDEALSEADAARQADPQPSSDLLRAEVLLRRDDPAGAMKEVEAAERRATDLRIGSVYGLEFLRADTLARLNMTGAAEEAYEREIADFPDHLQAYANLAVLYFVQQKRAKVEPILRQMVSANPTEAARALAVKTLETIGEKQAAAAFRRRDPSGS